MKEIKKQAYQRIDVNDRAYIQQALNNKMPVNKIAEQLGKNPSSIKREIERNREIEPPSGNDCLNKKSCKERNACKKMCNQKLCKFCDDCYKDDQCQNYIKGFCETLIDRSPHVCNGCKSRYTCPYEKYVYKGGVANKKATQKQKDKIRQFYCKFPLSTLMQRIVALEMKIYAGTKKPGISCFAGRFTNQ